MLKIINHKGNANENQMKYQDMLTRTWETRAGDKHKCPQDEEQLQILCKAIGDVGWESILGNWF